MAAVGPSAAIQKAYSVFSITSSGNNQLECLVEDFSLPKYFMVLLLLTCLLVYFVDLKFHLSLN